MIKLDGSTLDRLLAPYGLNSAAVEYLGGGREDSDGIVYSFGRDGGAMAVKVLAWKEPEESFARTRRRYEERIRFAFYLGSGGAPVVNPVPDGDGLLYRHCHFEGHGYISYLMDRIGGKPPAPEQWDGRLLGLWGGAVGKMHALAARHEHWRQSPETDIDGNPQLCWRNEVNGFRNWCGDPDIKRMWREMETRLDGLPAERQNFGFIHNDPHNHNILYDGSALRVIDFDVANYHWFATDIAIALQSVLFAKGGMERPVKDGEAIRRFFGGFMAGYAKEFSLDGSWLTKLDLFVNYRRMLLFTVMQDWLSTNEPVRTQWKNMILDEPVLFLP